MDHSMHSMDMAHGGHGDMDMGPKCKMNMLFTWSTEDLCIIFPGWHISGPLSLFFSLVGIVLLTAGYEAVRQAAQSYELKQLGGGRDAALGPSDHISSYHDDPVDVNDPEAAHQSTHGTAYRDDGENENETENAGTAQTTEADSSHLSAASSRTANVNDRQRRNTKVVLAAFYAVQVFYSFFIMLLFMTYNGWVMLSVAVGAFVGYLSFGGGSATRAVACH